MINQLSGQAERNILNAGVKDSGRTESSVAANTIPKRTSSDSPTIAKPQDSVSFSDEALQLSQSLSNNNRTTDVRDQNLQKKEDITKVKTTYFEIVKNYPPFLGNVKRLELLANYPQLLHEVEKMMVPPPFDAAAATVTTNEINPKDPQS